MCLCLSDLLSLSMADSRSAHITTNGIISFFIWLCPLDCKEIQPVHSGGDQSWVFFGRNDAKAETPVLWPPHVKS